ncbi:MAG: beta-N-acetylhexosaminidase [Spirochaetia bacterium]|jgi:beta-N-acetylhexosaminidase|nr:beta-N-acetylhexosaminidase [Spirochaetia bacterium]
MKTDDNLKIDIGQHFITGFHGTSMTDAFIQSVREYKIGNVILFADNIASRNQLQALIAEINTLILKETGTLPFIAVDQEGGMVTRLSNDFTNVPGALAIASTGRPENLVACIEATVKELSSVGINCNLAPVLDVNSNRNNPVIGIRSFAEDPAEAAKWGELATTTYGKLGFLCAGKHFPGHGDTSQDSHLTLPCVNKSYEELEQCELIPFKKAIEAGIPAIMTSHIRYPQIEPDHIPATMSKKIITGLLKEQLGFKGLVLSDCMEMQAISRYYGSVEGSAAAIAAGIDLVFISHHPLLAAEAAEGIVHALESGKIDRQQYETSSAKIRSFKERYVHLRQDGPLLSNEEKEKIAQIRKATLTVSKGRLPETGNKPLFIAPDLFRATNVSNAENSLSFARTLQGKLGGNALVIPPDPTETEINAIINSIEKMPAPSSLWIGSYNAHVFTGQLKLYEQLCKRIEAKKTLLVLRNTNDGYLLGDNFDCLIYAYEYTGPMLDILSDFIGRHKED